MSVGPATQTEHAHYTNGIHNLQQTFGKTNFFLHIHTYIRTYIWRYIHDYIGTVPHPHYGALYTELTEQNTLYLYHLLPQHVRNTYVCPTALKCNTSGLQLNAKPNGFVHRMNTKLDYKGTMGTHTHTPSYRNAIDQAQPGTPRGADWIQTLGLSKYEIDYGKMHNHHHLRCTCVCVCAYSKCS